MGKKCERRSVWVLTLIFNNFKQKVNRLKWVRNAVKRAILLWTDVFLVTELRWWGEIHIINPQGFYPSARGVHLSPDLSSSKGTNSGKYALILEIYWTTLETGRNLNIETHHWSSTYISTHILYSNYTKYHYWIKYNS